MSAARILIAESEGFPQEALELLRHAGSDVVLADLEYEELCNSVSGFDVLWVRLRNKIDQQLVDRASRLKILVTPTTGMTHVDTGSLARRGVHLLSLRGEVEFLRNVRATAELTIALMLSLLRHLPAAIADTKTGHWSRDSFLGNELYGRTVGVIGYGRLGSLVGKYLTAFESNVLVCDPKLAVGFREGGVRATSLEYLLTNSDIITLHADLNESNAGFLTADLIQKMKPGSYFLNTSRGELVDETALLCALQAGRIRGAALDVLSGENAQGMRWHPLVQYAATNNNLILTPHLGGCTSESKNKTEVFLAAKLCKLLATVDLAEALTTTSPAI